MAKGDRKRARQAEQQARHAATRERIEGARRVGRMTHLFPSLVGYFGGKQVMVKWGLPTLETQALFTGQMPARMALSLLRTRHGYSGNVTVMTLRANPAYWRKSVVPPTTQDQY